MVFDGYNNISTTKDTAHIKRCRSFTPNIEIQPKNVFDVDKESFLANSTNKQNFINLLGKKLDKAGIRVYHADGDADTKIISEALSSARQINTTVIGEDTDLLVLLLHHVDENMKSVFFKSLRSNESQVWDIKKAQIIIGTDAYRHIFFLHAFSGCDTTSRPFSIGKSHIINRFKKKILI